MCISAQSQSISFAVGKTSEGKCPMMFSVKDMQNLGFYMKFTPDNAYFYEDETTIGLVSTTKQEFTMGFIYRVSETMSLFVGAGNYKTTRDYNDTKLKRYWERERGYSKEVGFISEVIARDWGGIDFIGSMNTYSYVSALISVRLKLSGSR